MFKRVMVAVVGIPALILILSVAPAEATMLLVAGMCAVGAYELMHAAAGAQGRRLTPLAVLAAALVPVCVGMEEAVRGAALTAMPALPLTALLALLFVLALFVCAIRRYGTETALPFGGLTAAVFAGLVFPLMLSCLLRLRLLSGGELLVWVPLAISFGSDTLALFAGMLFGRHKLTPVSPKKTVEGAVGGLLGGVAGLALLNGLSLLVADQMLLGWGAAAMMGLLGSVAGQIGDLSFSVIKREFGVKDYGNLLPGHGGVLDRFDSVTFVAPLVWVAFFILVIL